MTMVLAPGLLADLSPQDAVVSPDGGRNKKHPPLPAPGGVVRQKAGALAAAMAT